jgi:hypothetical protein
MEFNSAFKGLNHTKLCNITLNVSGMWRRVVWYTCNNVWKATAASIIMKSNLPVMFVRSSLYTVSRKVGQGQKCLLLTVSSTTRTDWSRWHTTICSCTSTQHIQNVPDHCSCHGSPWIRRKFTVHFPPSVPFTLFHRKPSRFSKFLVNIAILNKKKLMTTAVTSFGCSRFSSIVNVSNYRKTCKIPSFEAAILKRIRAHFLFHNAP